MDTHPVPDPAAVFEAVRRLSDEPPPSDPMAGGCTVAIVALVALVFMPLVTRVKELDAGTLFAVGVGLAITVVVGSLLGLFGGRVARGSVIARVRRSIAALASSYPGGDPGEQLDHAVRILIESAITSGPQTVATYDRTEVGERLGPALDYVVAVERILLEREEIQAVFTSPPSGRRPEGQTGG